MRYKAIEIKDGNSTESVQYVGVYALHWQREWGAPEMGFVEDDETVGEDDIKRLAAEYALNLVGGDNIGSTAYLSHYAVFLAAGTAVLKLLK